MQDEVLPLHQVSDNFLSLRTSCIRVPGLSVQPSNAKEEADISHFQTEPEEWQRDASYL